MVVADAMASVCSTCSSRVSGSCVSLWRRLKSGVAVIVGLSGGVFVQVMASPIGVVVVVALLRECVVVLSLDGKDVMRRSRVFILMCRALVMREWTVLEGAASFIVAFRFAAGARQFQPRHVPSPSGDSLHPGTSAQLKCTDANAAWTTRESSALLPSSKRQRANVMAQWRASAALVRPQPIAPSRLGPGVPSHSPASNTESDGVFLSLKSLRNGDFLRG
jgi:hypothetical protein